MKDLRPLKMVIALSCYYFFGLSCANTQQIAISFASVDGILRLQPPTLSLF